MTAMPIFRIPLVWMEYGHMNIEADTLEKAIKIALDAETPLPEGNYVDESVQVDRDALDLEEGNHVEDGKRP